MRGTNEPPELGFEKGNCSICGKPTVRPVMAIVEQQRGENKEPLVCNKCMLDLRGDMATELEVRRQIGNLEAKVEGYAWKQWVLYFTFSIVFSVLMFLLGVQFGSQG